MKTITVMFDEALLERLDQRPEVRERGRSAVLREAAAEYLARTQSERIDREYERAYGNVPGGYQDPDLEGWADEGVDLDD